MTTVSRTQLKVEPLFFIKIWEFLKKLGMTKKEIEDYEQKKRKEENQSNK